MGDPCVDLIFNSFFPFLNLSIEEISLVGTERFPIPKFSSDQIENLFKAMHETIITQGPLIRVSLPTYVVGDIHGNFHDLLRIFNTIGDFIAAKIVFLGDYVDRGCFSLDVILLLFSLVVKYPYQFFLIRGNHEFECVNSLYGFKTEVAERYGDDNSLYDSVHKLVFNYMPFAALVGSEIVCLHGGLGPNVSNISNIDKIQMPVSEYNNDIVSDIIWSDPTTEFTTFIGSTRGTGVLFGRLAVHDFLKSSCLSKIVRGHQCVQHGVNNFAGGMVVTVFSSSNYINKQNSAGFILIDESNTIRAQILQPIHFLNRNEAVFSDIKQTPVKREMNHISCLNFGKTASFKLSKWGKMMPVTKTHNILNSSFVGANILKPKVFPNTIAKTQRGPEQTTSLLSKLVDG